MSNKRKRIEKAEQQSGAGDDRPVIVVTWGDDPEQIVKVNGVEMTLREFDEKYPDAKQITWGDIGDE